MQLMKGGHIKWKSGCLLKSDCRAQVFVLLTVSVVARDYEIKIDEIDPKLCTKSQWSNEFIALSQFTGSFIR
jgi:hypothetical protein